ncbi:hypothetical protein Aduo_018764 [Ancylostoma duodenale]
MTSRDERRRKPGPKDNFVKLNTYSRNAHIKETAQLESRCTCQGRCSLQSQLSKIQGTSCPKAFVRGTVLTMWKTKRELEISLDGRLSSYFGSNKFFKMASARIEDGETLTEAGVLKSNFQLTGPTMAFRTLSTSMPCEG